jgi:mycothiol system anti-sigma-R factor
VPCEQTQNQLHGYLDGELDAQGAASFEKHLESCPDCQKQLDTEESLRRSLQQSSLYERAPRSLQVKLAETLPAPRPAAARLVRPWQWFALAATALLACLFTWQLLAPFNSSRTQSTLAAAVLDAHLRSLQPGHLEDVESTDQHTVKPWFDGRLDFAPPVRDFANDGFPLLGGRLDVINGQSVAALVYGRRKHIINVLVWKTSALPSSAGGGELQGYHWLSWNMGDLTFYAVSDSASADLNQLRDLFTKN